MLEIQKNFIKRQILNGFFTIKTFLSSKSKCLLNKWYFACYLSLKFFLLLNEKLYLKVSTIENKQYQNCSNNV